MVMHTKNPSTQRLRQEDQKFKASLVYIIENLTQKINKQMKEREKERDGGGREGGRKEEWLRCSSLVEHLLSLMV
jgi:hypothetical protein